MTQARDHDAVYPAALSRSSVRFLTAAAIGTRVVARYRIAGGFTDALGDLLACDARTAVILTRRGQVTVPLGDVVAAKAVPPPPARRTSRPTDADPGTYSEPDREIT